MGMCYYIRSIPEVLYYIPIAEQIPKFNEKFLLEISDILIGYWYYVLIQNLESKRLIN